MAIFQPEVNQRILIDGVSYALAVHPAAPGMPYGQEGRQAVVYQLCADDGHRCGFKVFKPRFRVPALVSLADQLAPLASMPGLAVCDRTVLSARRHHDLLVEHPDLTYAVLMPWIYGPTWMEVLLGGEAISPKQSLLLARSLGETLACMEESGLAHCDLSGPNVLVPGMAPESAPGSQMIALVDVEQMYGPNLRRPPLLPGGSPGYAHKTASEGLWSAEADRFAGAVLMAEMLGWCDPRVRAASWGESYFDPQELGRDTRRYSILLQSLKEIWGSAAAGHFERVWHSDTLIDCSTFGEWLVSLPREAPDESVIPAEAHESNQSSDSGQVSHYNLPSEHRYGRAANRPETAAARNLRRIRRSGAPRAQVLKAVNERLARIPYWRTVGAALVAVIMTVVIMLVTLDTPDRHAAHLTRETPVATQERQRNTPVQPTSIANQPPLYALSGRVIGPDGHGVGKVIVRFGEGLSSVLTDPDGFWQKDGLAGSVTVKPHKEGWAFAPESRFAGGSSATADFSAKPVIASPEPTGTQHRQDVPAPSATPARTEPAPVTRSSRPLPPPRPIYKVSGRVTDEVGNPIGGVLLTFGSGHGTVQTDASGSWSKSGLSGTIPILIKKPGWSFTPTIRQVSEAGNSVNFIGRYKLFTLAGRVTDIKGRGIPGVTISFGPGFDPVITDRDGYWVKMSLEGAVTVTPQRGSAFFTPVSITAYGPGVLSFVYTPVVSGID